MPAVRAQLRDHWQSIGIDLVKRGFPPEAVFESMLTVGLAGLVELQGKDAAAEWLLAVARRLSEQVKTEAEAMREASGATKN
ncbi:MAG TPA: hypothetical protein VM434_00325 [Beijerinckiaceae bacterium]|nr:hypothetical protein [Beijerinckiaceae bacterium]